MPNEQMQDHFDIREYLRPVRSRLWLILLVVVVATAGTYAYHARKAKIYTSSTQIYFTSSEVDQIIFGGKAGRVNESTVETNAALLTTRPVAAEAAKRLGFRGDPGVLLGSVAAGSSEKSAFLTVSATYGNPEDAARIANAFADAYVGFRTKERRRQARGARIAAEKELAREEESEVREDLKTRIQRLESIETVTTSSGGIRRLDPAVPHATPIAPKPKQDALFAFVLSLAFAVGGVFALERIDRRIKRVDDLESVYGEPILGDLPEVASPAPVVDGEPGLYGDFREAFRSLRMNLDLARLDGDLRTIVVTSAVPGEGKSTVTRNLAIVFREAGLRVGVIDTDLRAPRMDQMLLTEREPGLTHVLTGGATLEEALKEASVSVEGLETLAKLRAGGTATATSPTNGNGNGAGHVGDQGDRGIGALMVLGSGTTAANPSAVLGAEQMRAVLKTCAEQFDVVLIDTAPMLAVSDAVPLLSAADGVIIVSRLGETTVDSARRLRSQLERVSSARVLGVVANGVSRGNNHRRGYAHYYYAGHGGA